jgi:multidrug efflux system membrane fusion protein
MKTIKNHFPWRQLIILSLLVIVSIHPVSTALAADQSVTASAVIIPAQISELGFMISGHVKEIPVKEGETVTTGQALMTLDAPDLQYAVVEAQAALHAAQSYADLQKYQKVKDQRNGKIFYDTVPEVYRQRADARVLQAQVALEIAQINDAEATLKSPFDGAVASINVVPGEFAEADQALITVATLKDLQLETTDLSEQDITNVRIGAPVDIAIEALNDTFKGTVVSISPIADTIGGDVVFNVTIAFDKQPPGILWGMTAEVTIGS